MVENHPHMVRKSGLSSRRWAVEPRERAGEGRVTRMWGGAAGKGGGNEGVKGYLVNTADGKGRTEPVDEWRGGPCFILRADIARRQPGALPVARQGGRDPVIRRQKHV